MHCTTLTDYWVYLAMTGQLYILYGVDYYGLCVKCLVPIFVTNFFCQSVTVHRRPADTGTQNVVKLWQKLPFGA
jgi:hypothetical protein